MKYYGPVTDNYDLATKKYVDDNAGGGGSSNVTTLFLKYNSSNGRYLSSTADSTTALTFNQIDTYAQAGPVLIRPVTMTNYAGGLIATERIASVDLVAGNYEDTPVFIILRINYVDDNGNSWSSYLRLSASSTTAAMYAGTSDVGVTTPLMTVAQLTAGTDNYDRPVSAKVIHDYIASLDASNTAY